MVTGLGFNGITEMQQMTSNVCSNAAPGLEGRLRDTRDDKVYWVSKLKDNNCWMTQNLDLDLNQADLLTSSNSDVSNNWPSSALSNTLWTGDSSNYNSLNYYDPTNLYFTLPNGIVSVDDFSEWTATYDPYFVTATNFIGLDGQSICNKGAGSMLGDSTYKQCHIYYYAYAHYHVGNYYSWGAATAGQATSLISNVTGEQSTQSICPKGWTLPINGAYSNLFGSYGANSGITYGGIAITGTPFYFVYGGIVNSSSLANAGSRGYYWSSTANYASNAYTLTFSTSVNPSSDTNRYYGMSVRCVAR